MFPTLFGIPRCRSRLTLLHLHRSSPHHLLVLPRRQRPLLSLLFSASHLFRQRQAVALVAEAAPPQQAASLQATPRLRRHWQCQWLAELLHPLQHLSWHLLVVHSLRVRQAHLVQEIS